MHGGMVSQQVTDYNEVGQRVIQNKRWREPGIVKLAYESIIAKIGATENAEFTIQLSSGLICNEETEDLLSGQENKA